MTGTMAASTSSSSSALPSSGWVLSAGSGKKGTRWSPLPRGRTQPQPLDPHRPSDRGQRCPQCPRLPAGGSSSAGCRVREPGELPAYPPSCSSPAPTLHGSLHGHGQQAGHHRLVVVPAAFCILLALQGHAVQALAHRDHVLGIPGLTPCRAQSTSHQTVAAATPLICSGILGQCRPPYTPSSGGIHSPALGSQHRCHPRSPLDITSNGGSSCPDTLHGAACCGLHYLSAPFGDAAAGQGRSPSQCWCGWTRLPGPAGSVAAGSSGHGSSPPPALKRKHTSEGCWADPRPPRPRTFRAQTLPGWTG